MVLTIVCVFIYEKNMYMLCEKIDKIQSIIQISRRIFRICQCVHCKYVWSSSIMV